MELKVRNTVFKQGRPQIAVSITGRSLDEIMAQCQQAADESVQVIEWRADYYLSAIPSIADKLVDADFYMDLLNIFYSIREKAGEIPVIFTIRSKAQGGLAMLTNDQTQSLQLMAAESGAVDLIDVEIKGFKKQNGGIGGQSLLDRVNKIHQAGARVILSYHDFEEMITADDQVRLIMAMAKYHGDICKVAAMASDEKDVKALLRATAYLTAKGIGPVVTMAMGEAGTVTRIIGGKYGSVMTFASLGQASAPGQIPVRIMKAQLDKFYGEK